MNFYQELGPLVFGTRLKRLSEYFLSEINKVYADNKIPFEASWFGVFYLLDKHKTMSILDISEKLEVSHSAISQFVKTLQEKKLIFLTPCPQDGRRKEIALSSTGKRLLKKIKPIWVALDETMSSVMNKNDALKNLLKIEQDFDKITLSERIKSKLNV